MPSEFDDPGEQMQLESHEFGNQEPGLNHPDNPAFIRLRNDGAIEIMADDGVGIILDPRSRSITMVADHVKFFTREEGGIRWNDTELNSRATRFDEPTLVQADNEGSITDLYRDTSWFMDEDDEEAEEKPRDKITKARRYFEDRLWHDREG